MSMMQCHCGEVHPPPMCPMQTQQYASAQQNQGRSGYTAPRQQQQPAPLAGGWYHGVDLQGYATSQQQSRQPQQQQQPHQRQWNPYQSPLSPQDMSHPQFDHGSPYSPLTPPQQQLLPNRQLSAMHPMQMQQSMGAHAQSSANSGMSAHVNAPAWHPTGHPSDRQQQQQQQVQQQQQQQQQRQLDAGAALFVPRNVQNASQAPTKYCPPSKRNGPGRATNGECMPDSPKRGVAERPEERAERVIGVVSEWCADAGAGRISSEALIELGVATPLPVSRADVKGTTRLQKGIRVSFRLRMLGGDAAEASEVIALPLSCEQLGDMPLDREYAVPDVAPPKPGQNPWEIDIVFFHASCWDGLCAAYAFYHAAGPERRAAIEFLPIPSNFSCDPSLPSVKDKNIAVVDVVFNKETLQQITAECNSYIIIDHHTSSEAVLLRGEDVDNDSVRFDVQHSAAAISWQFCKLAHVHAPQEIKVRCCTRGRTGWTHTHTLTGHLCEPGCLRRNPAVPLTCWRGGSRSLRHGAPPLQEVGDWC